MNTEQLAVIVNCANQSLRGETTFPEVVQSLQAIGLERYHIDYSCHVGTYYLPSGAATTLTLAHPDATVAETFNAVGVESAVRAIQRGEIYYQEFLQRTMEAGCIGYTVFISGARVLYFGRNGDVHEERFGGPSAN